MELIETVELASSASSITFSSIPQTYTDLKLVLSARSTRTTSNYAGFEVKPNGIATSSSIRLYGLGGSAGTDTTNNQGLISINANTANTFGNASVYISNYTSSANKSISSDAVSENNATDAGQTIVASLWNNTAAITSIEITTDNGAQDFVAGTTASLYGITAGGSGTVS